MVRFLMLTTHLTLDEGLALSEMVIWRFGDAMLEPRNTSISMLHKSESSKIKTNKDLQDRSTFTCDMMVLKLDYRISLSVSIANNDS